MAAAVGEEVEDLTCCSICFYPYDEDVHKPKFLACHHTFCLGCITAIPRAKGWLKCPSCRRGMRCTPGKESELSNNPYALPLLTAAGNNNNATAAPQTGVPSHEGRWCSNCQKEALPSCMDDHHITFLMGSLSAEFCFQLVKSKGLHEAQLSSIIQTRKEARTYLHEVSTAHKLAGEAIQRLEDENNDRFAQMNSLLESSSSVTVDETALSLSLKLEAASEQIKEELMGVEVVQKRYLRHINGRTKITFACHREGKKLPCNLPLCEQELDLSSRNQIGDRSKMLKAATHVLLSLLDIGDVPLAPVPLTIVPLPRAPLVRSRIEPKAPQTTTPSSLQPGTRIDDGEPLAAPPVPIPLPPPPPTALLLPTQVLILLANVNPPPDRTILFPTVESCRLVQRIMKTGTVRVWKVVFNIPGALKQPNEVELLIPNNIVNVEDIQWWILVEDSIPDEGLTVTGLTKGPVPFTIPKLMMLKFQNLIQLKLRFPSYDFIAPSCYLSKLKPGFIIMGPLPANCPAEYPCIMRIPLTR